MTLNFIDVSKHQGTIDWAKVAKEVDGVIIRCAYRGYGSTGNLVTDEKWKNNIEGAIAAGIKRIGVYIFSQAVNAAEGKEEAEKVLSLIQPYGDKISYPVYWDTEKTSEYPNGRADQISKRARTDACKAFCEAVAAAGYTPGVYASLSYFDEGLYPDELKGYTWWVAAYRSTRPEMAKDAWQYTSSGSVTGITGKVDRNYFYRDFAPLDGWVETDKGWYWYENGQPVKSAWRKITGASGVPYWYYFGENGLMLTGMQRIDGKVYYLNPAAVLGVPEGAMIQTDENGVVYRG